MLVFECGNNAPELSYSWLLFAKQIALFELPGVRAANDWIIQENQRKKAAAVSAVVPNTTSNCHAVRCIRGGQLAA